MIQAWMLRHADLVIVCIVLGELITLAFMLVYGFHVFQRDYREFMDWRDKRRRAGEGGKK